MDHPGESLPIFHGDIRVRLTQAIHWLALTAAAWHPPVREGRQSIECCELRNLNLHMLNCFVRYGGLNRGCTHRDQRRTKNEEHEAK